MLQNSVEVSVDGQNNNKPLFHSFPNVFKHLTPTLDTLKRSKSPT